MLAKMRIFLSAVSVVATLAAFLGACDAFSAVLPSVTRQTSNTFVSVALTTEAAAMADSGVPPETSEASDVAEEEIPTNLPSDVGMDYIPLATMLATGQLAEADQVRLMSSCFIQSVNHTQELRLNTMLCISLLFSLLVTR